MACRHDLGQAHRRNERQHQDSGDGEHFLDADPNADRDVDHWLSLVNLASKFSDQI